MLELDVWLRRDAVCTRVGLSRSKIYSLIATGRFPRPIKLGVRSVWSSAELAVWQADRLRERDEPRTYARRNRRTPKVSR